MQFAQSKDKTIVEYAVQGTQQPIGVSTFQTQGELPPDIQSSLPTVEQFELELSAAIEEMEDEEREAPDD